MERRNFNKLKEEQKEEIKKINELVKEIEKSNESDINLDFLKGESFFKSNNAYASLYKALVLMGVITVTKEKVYLSYSNAYIKYYYETIIFCKGNIDVIELKNYFSDLDSLKSQSWQNSKIEKIQEKIKKLILNNQMGLIFAGARKILENADKLDFNLCKAIFELKDTIDSDYTENKISGDNWYFAEKCYIEAVIKMVKFFETTPSLLRLAQLGEYCRGSDSYELFAKKVLLSISLTEFNSIHENEMSGSAQIDQLKQAFKEFSQEKIDTITDLARNKNRQKLEEKIGDLFNIKFRFIFKLNFATKDALSPEAGNFVIPSVKNNKPNLKTLRCSKIPGNKLILPMDLHGNAFVERKIVFNLAKSFCNQSKIGLELLEPVTVSGPSGGLSIFCGMVSAITGTPVPNDITMTGELEPDGKIYFVGFIAAKLTAADISGFIKRVVLPEGNKPDFEAWKKQNPESKLEEVYVKNVRQLMRAVFGEDNLFIVK